MIPQALVDLEVAHTGLTELHTVANMHERKAKMTELADAFLALPGGIGTLDELFEAWSWNALGYHAKPFCLLNVDGFWDGHDRVHRPCDATAASCRQQRRSQLLVARHARAKRSNCWTKPPQPLRKAWSGKRVEPRGRGCLNE